MAPWIGPKARGVDHTFSREPAFCDAFGTSGREEPGVFVAIMPIPMKTSSSAD